jgi:hypothetical protein
METPYFADIATILLVSGMPAAVAASSSVNI